MLFSVDLHEDFIDEEGIAIASVLSLQAARIDGSELDAPESDSLATGRDASLS